MGDWPRRVNPPAASPARFCVCVCVLSVHALRPARLNEERRDSTKMTANRLLAVFTLPRSSPEGSHARLRQPKSKGDWKHLFWPTRLLPSSKMSCWKGVSSLDFGLLQPTICSFFLYKGLLAFKTRNQEERRNYDSVSKAREQRSC